MTGRAALRHAIEALYYANQDAVEHAQEEGVDWTKEWAWHSMRQEMLSYFVVHLWYRLDPQERDSPEGHAVVSCADGGYLIDFVSLGMEPYWNGTAEASQGRQAPGGQRRGGRRGARGTGGAAAPRA